MEDILIKVLIQVDEQNIITAINSNIFITDTTDWIQIDEGTGDKYAHAQGHYLDIGLYDAHGHGNYIYDGGAVRLLTDAEKKVLFPPKEAVLTPMEILQKENILLKAQVKALSDQGEYQNDLIAEMAMVIYA